VKLRRRSAASILALGALAAIGLFPARSGAQRADVWTLKVAFVERIASFLTWPKDADLERPEHPFIWTFLGKTPLLSRAQTVYAHRRIQNHPVVIRTAEHASEIGPTHVLFIASTCKEDIGRIVARLGVAPVLTVADTPGMARRGVAVNLYEANDKIRFEINRSSLRRARIRASFRLLTLARIIPEPEP
jgi:YfiR/HmsC-like